MVRVVMWLIVLGASVAHADVKTDIEKLVRANIAAAAADNIEDFEKTTAAARVLVLPNGKSALDGKLVAELYGPRAKKVAHRVEGLHVVADAGRKLAWFHGSYMATFVVDKKKQTLPMRICGIAADEGEPLGWKLQALMFARTIPDKELAALATEASRSTPRTTGEATATKVVASWFADGGSIASGRSKNVAVEANGTGASEIGNGTFAVKLVTLWESARMWAIGLEATAYADNEIAFVRADVMLPVDKLAARLVLGIILVKENNVWRWVTMSLGPVIDA